MSDESARRHDELAELVAVYAIGALPVRDADAVRLHLDECADCRAEYAALHPVIEALGVAAAAELSDAEVARAKAQLLERIAARPATVVPLPQRPTPVWPAYAAALLAIGIAVNEAVGNAGLRHQIAAYGQALAQRDAVIADLTAPNERRFAVPGGEIVRRDAKLYVAMQRLAPLPPGRVYQVWTLAPGAKSVAPSVTFAPSPSGVTVVEVPAAAPGVAALAISVEPAGGSPRPTTAPLFVRKLS